MCKWQANGRPVHFIQIYSSVHVNADICPLCRCDHVTACNRKSSICTSYLCVITLALSSGAAMNCSLPQKNGIVGSTVMNRLDQIHLNLLMIFKCAISIYKYLYSALKSSKFYHSFFSSVHMCALKQQRSQ